MSRKISSLTSIITTPLNQHMFKVVIPNIDDGEAFSVVVSSTVYPSYLLRETVLHIQGEEVRYPAQPVMGGDWQVTVPESDQGRMYKVIKSMLSEVYDEKTGIVKAPKYRDIQVFSQDLGEEPVFKAILHDSWIKGVTQVQLSNADATQSWSWPVTFCYGWLETESLK